jgi:hypothetical protein
MRDKGFSEKAILSALEVTNTEQCDPPLPFSDICRLAKSAAKYEPSEHLAADVAIGSEAIDELKKKYTPEKPGFYFSCANDLVCQPSPIEWTVKNWIPDKGLSMIYGESGHGKTFITLDMACCIAAGIDWHGNRVKPGVVLYFAGEGNYGIRQRLAAWMQARGIDKLDNFFLSNRAIDLDVQHDLLMAMREATSVIEKPVSSVFVDTLNNHMSGDENLSKDTRKMIGSCGLLATNFECSVSLNHHVGHGQDAKNRARGSSAWKASLDSMLFVSMRQSGLIEVKNTKQKDAPITDPVYFELEQVRMKGWVDDENNPVTSAVPIAADPEPEVEKVDNTTKKHRDMIEKAWRESSGETIDDCPYISRSALKGFLIKFENMTEKTAGNNLSPGDTKKLIGYLLNKNMIEKHADGFKIIDDESVFSLTQWSKK